VGRSEKWVVACVAVLAFVAYLANANRSPLGDTAAAFPIAESLLTDGDLLLDEYARSDAFVDGGWVTESDEGLVGYFPWAVAVAAMPFVVIVETGGQIGIGPGAFELIEPMGRNHSILQHLAASFWTALAVAGVYVIVRRRAPERSVRFALVVTTVFALGTSAWSTASILLWQHGPSLALITWTLVLTDRLLRDRGRGMTQMGAFALGCCSLAAFAVRPTNALLLGALGLVVGLRAPRSLPALAGGATAVAIPWLAVTRATYGTWLQSYGTADRIGLHDDYGEALAANLISTGRGLLIFSPVAVLAFIGMWRAVRSPTDADDVTWLAIALSLSHLLVVSALPHWIGGHSYGPRLMTDALPYLAVIALPVVDSLPHLGHGPRSSLATSAVIVLAVASIAFHAQTLIRSSDCWNVTPVNVDDDYGRVWSRSDPMVTAGYRDLLSSPGAALRGECR
jgi:hypothetical protein